MLLWNSIGLPHGLISHTNQIINFNLDQILFSASDTNYTLNPLATLTP